METVLDFYTHRHWQKLNSCVQEFVDATDPPDWAWFLAQNPAESPKPSRVIPLSLLALKSCSQYLSLERTAVNLDQAETIQDIIHVLQNDTSSKKACLNGTASACNRDGTDTIFKATPFQKPNYKNGQCMDMQHIFRKHVKPKKQHEIQQLGKVIQVLSQMTNCKSVIDVGAGLGHLSRLLTFLHGLQVTTVEAADGHAPKAAAFDKELKKDVLKKLNKICSKEAAVPPSEQKIHVPETEIESDSVVQTGASSLSKSSSGFQQDQNNMTAAPEAANHPHPENPYQETVLSEKESLPSHVVCYIQPDIAASQFLDIVRTTKSGEETSEQTQDADENKFILAGLHACGDLTPTLLKVFVQCPSAVALASVGCCYMKMNASLDEESSSGSCVRLENYPMSDFLKGHAGHSLNYESREMACHFADAYCQRLKDNPVHLKIHSYRAALQYLIKTVTPDFASGQLRLVCKKGAEVAFPQHASEVLKKLDIDIATVPKELLLECEELTLSWKRVVAFYTIRLSLAPAVEALVLLDRILFLRELGMNGVLVPIFDSRLSPRNFALLAIKS